MRQKAIKSTPSRILVVEDDKSIAGMLKNVLVEQGYHVTVTNDGDEASELLLTAAPDLILLDLHIPHRTGFDLLREVRKKDRELGVFVPVIVLTGVYTSRHDKVNSLDAGADDFISKPFDLIELLARVRSLLRVQELYKRSQFLATHDHLTRCYNRRYLLDFLDREFERYKRYKSPLTYMMLDLDHFKEINDEAGHEGGDQILLHVGFRLQNFFRAVDCVARLGGDEFAAVLPDCNAHEAMKVGERLQLFMNRSEQKDGLPEKLTSKVSFSIGIACLPEHTKDKEELMRLADEALYAAKRAGRNQFRMFQAVRTIHTKHG